MVGAIATFAVWSLYFSLICASLEEHLPHDLWRWRMYNSCVVVTLERDARIHMQQHTMYHSTGTRINEKWMTISCERSIESSAHRTLTCVACVALSVQIKWQLKALVRQLKSFLLLLALTFTRWMTNLRITGKVHVQRTLGTILLSFFRIIIFTLFFVRPPPPPPPPPAAASPLSVMSEKRK